MRMRNFAKGVVFGGQKKSRENENNYALLHNYSRWNFLFRELVLFQLAGNG